MTHTDSQKTPKFLKRGLSRRFLLLVAGASFALAGCPTGMAPQGGDGGTSTPGTYTIEGDYILGRADASITVLEYASVACPACANWHATVYPDFKKEFVDTGKVNYVFRPFPTSPIEIADTGHKLAYCAPREDYFKNIKLQFDRQRQIFDMMKKGQLRQVYVSLAKASGLSEEEFISCITDADVQKRYDDVVQLGSDLGVTSTPTFFINGVKSKVYTIEDMRAAILPMLGEAVPDPATDKTED